MLVFLYLILISISAALSAQNTPIDKLSAYLDYLSLTKDDVGIYSTAELSNKNPYVESLLGRPIPAIAGFHTLIKSTENFKDPASVFLLAAGLLSSDTYFSKVKLKLAPDEAAEPDCHCEEVATATDVAISIENEFRQIECPQEIRPELLRLLEALKESGDALSSASPPFLKGEFIGGKEISDFLLTEEEPDFWKIMGFEKEKNISDTVKYARCFEKLEEVKTDYLFESFYHLLKYTQDFSIRLRETKADFGLRKRYSFSFGDIILSGAGDDTYDESVTSGCVLIIDTGGKNIYRGKVAFGTDSKPSVVIDNGMETLIESAGLSSGAAINGIGLMYLSNPGGKKKIITGDYSCGSAALGLGALIVEGKVEIEAGESSIGFGKFGIGIYYNGNDKGSVYMSESSSQGSGQVKGVGVCYSRGSGSLFEAGLESPDPREEKGSTSLSQGFGYGNRAITGGGIGVMKITGDSNTARSSYMCQGSGYWHALGAFDIEGDSNTIVARRYSQGTGVHAAIGLMSLSGDNNTQINWGVGPAYGWDFSLGFYFGEGNGNTVRADWGAGHAETGQSFSFTHFKGDNNRFRLNDYATGADGRKMNSYAFGVFEGKGNIFLSGFDFPGRDLYFFKNPWGFFYGQDITYDSKAVFQEYQWEKTGFSKKRRFSGRRSLEEILAQAENETGFARLNSLLKAASAFSLRPDLEHEALKQILQTPDSEISLLLDLYSPYRVEEIIPMTAVVYSFGGAAFPELSRRIELSTGAWRAAYLSLLRGMPIPEAYPVLMKSLDVPDFKVSIPAIRALGMLFSTETGRDAGNITFLKACLNLLVSPTFVISDAEVKSFSKEIGDKMVYDLFSVLARSGDFLKDEKAGLYMLGTDLFGPVPENGIKYFMELLLAKREVLKPVLEKELSFAKKKEKEARQALALKLKNGDRKIKSQVLGALGMIGNPKDMDMVFQAIDDGSANVRDNAYMALARSGKKAVKKLGGVFNHVDSKKKRYIALMPVYTEDEDFIGLIEPALLDPEVFVRLSGLSALTRIKNPDLKKLARFIPVVGKLSEDADPGVRYMAKYVQDLSKSWK